MKSKILLIAMAVFAISAGAQNNGCKNGKEDCCKNDKNFFNHLSVGLNLGTTGIGLDVAMPVGNYVQVRAGVDFMPNIKVKTDLDIDAPQVAGYDIPDNVEVEGKIGFTNGKLLFDVYPFKRSSFHVTAGAYFGSSKIVKAYNKEDGLLMDITKFNNDVEAGLIPGQDKIGVELGDYLLEPDENGNVNASIKTASFKPYLGIGFGRAVPKKRFGCMFDLGVQFWGTPKVYCFDKRLTEDDANGGDGGVIKTISKIKVYPTLNFRICGRIL